MRVAILGSTGSIGRQAIEVATAHPDKVEVVALAAHSSDSTLAQQAHVLGVTALAMHDHAAAERLASAIPSATVGRGSEGVVALAQAEDVDVVLNSLVGSAGLEVTLASLAAGKTLALANKESLVVGGDLVMSLAAHGQIIPVDSEHSAILQCLSGEHGQDVGRLWLTASGGPFRGWTREQLTSVTARMALAHPTWSMGPKISVDSATLMNKGLETIEAHHLFGVEYHSIHVVVHPQSCVHSMVEFVDGSVKAHLGPADMRIPIQYAFSAPRRWPASAEPVDFRKIGTLEFAEPDTDTFGCLRLAVEAGKAGGTAPTALNAANEVAVAAFLEGACGFLDIEGTVAEVLARHDVHPLESVEQLRQVDAFARETARAYLKV